MANRSPRIREGQGGRGRGATESSERRGSTNCEVVRPSLRAVPPHASSDDDVVSGTRRWVSVGC